MANYDEFATEAVVTRGVLDAPPGWHEAVRHFDGPVVLTIGPVTSRKRSLAQNRRYWQLLTMISEHTGMDKESLHGYFRAKFLAQPFALANADGELVDATHIGGSTTKLGVQAFTEYMDKVELFAQNELGFTKA